MSLCVESSARGKRDRFFGGVELLLTRRSIPEDTAGDRVTSCKTKPSDRTTGTYAVTGFSGGGMKVAQNEHV